MSALVSVIIPAYNVEHHIRACLQSMLNQTYVNQEILIVNDAATDNTLDAIHQLADERIRVIQNETNLGLAASVNKAIRQARGAYIARMDADDVADPKRLQMQVDYLEQHADISILGTAMRSFGYSKYRHEFPESHEACKAQLLFNVCFGHPSVLIRKSVFDNTDNFYREDLRQYGEEYDLWCRLVDHVQFANLPDVLLAYRTFEPVKKSVAERKRSENSFSIRRNFIALQLGEQAEGDYLYHDHVCNLRRAGDINELNAWCDWLKRILLLNVEQKSFEQGALQAEISKRCFEIRYWNTHLGLKNLKAWHRDRYCRGAFKPSVTQYMKFILRSLLKL